MVDNCWEFKNCDVKEDCPAYPDFGHSCYGIKETLCRGEVQGDYWIKIERCRKCDYYLALMNRK